MNILSRFWYWLTLKWRREASPRNLYCLLNYTWVSQAVYVVVQLKVPDHLDSGPKTVEELAQLTGTKEPLLNQVMRSLAGFRIFATDSDGRYRNTAISNSLVSTRSSWLRQYVFFWQTHLYPSANAMLEMVRTGRSAFNIAHGKQPYELYSCDGEHGNIFMDFMNSVTDWQNPAIIKFFDLRPYRHIIDVGGGRASFISAILQANPHLRGTIFDAPYNQESATARLRESNLLDRCSFVGGNFFESVPPGADLYTLKHVLTDWPDSDAVRILTNVAAAMSPSSSLVLVESVMDDRDGVDQVLKMRNLEEMIFTGGRVRTKKELNAILQPAGLEWVRDLPTAVADCNLIYVRRKS